MKRILDDWVVPTVIIILIFVIIVLIRWEKDSPESVRDSVNRHSNSQRGWYDHDANVYRERNER